MPFSERTNETKDQRYLSSRDIQASPKAPPRVRSVGGPRPGARHRAANATREIIPWTGSRDPGHHEEARGTHAGRSARSRRRETRRSFLSTRRHRAPGRSAALTGDPGFISSNSLETCAPLPAKYSLNRGSRDIVTGSMTGAGAFPSTTSTPSPPAVIELEVGICHSSGPPQSTPSSKKSDPVKPVLETVH